MDDTFNLEEKDTIYLKQIPPAFFTVIIATYNRASLITRALDSLITQTEKDWEAVIVDDGSTDETLEHITPYLKMHPAIKYIHQTHMGGAAAKNRGLYAATGKYVTFLDSDDQFETDHLAIRKAVLIEYPSVSFLYGGTIILGNRYVPDRFDHTRLIHLNDCVIGGTFVIERKTALLLNGFRDLPIGCDADLFERVKKKGVRMMAVDTPTYVYHHETADSVTNRLAAE
jgi:glycosyltransferase involved in cell wall biosynthesis